MPIHLRSAADVQNLLAGGVGVPGAVVIVGAGSVHDGATMLELLAGSILHAATDDGAGQRQVTGLEELRTVAALSDFLDEIHTDLIPRLEQTPTDYDTLRPLNTVGKDVRRAANSLRDDYGIPKLSTPQVDGGPLKPVDTGSLGSTLGNSIHKMVSRAFRERRGGGPVRSEAARGIYIADNLPNLRDHVALVLHQAVVWFDE